MKVVVLGTRGFPGVQGGVERHCEELYPRLASLGCDITVITRSPYIQPEKQHGEFKGVRFIHLWCPRKKTCEALIHTFLGVLKARGRSPDILHIHGIGPALFVPLAKTLGMKAVMTHHGPDYMRAKWGDAAKTVLRLGERAGIGWSDAVIAISNGIKDDIKRRFGKEVAFIPNGVSMPSIIPPGEELKRFSLEPRKYIFSACRFVPEKGLRDLVDAYASLKNPAFKLVIAGEADHETEYSRGLKKRAGETPGVVLTGFKSGPALGELFSNAGLFVLPSYYEGLPIALLEALSYGLPVLVSDIPQHREVGLKGECYFRAGDLGAMSAAISVFFSSNHAPNGNSHAALLKGLYDWDDIALRTLEAYKGVIRASNRQW